MWDVSPTLRSAKFQLIYGLKMSKTAALDTFTVYICYLQYMQCHAQILDMQQVQLHGGHTILKHNTMHVTY